jgi:hypothetical protein
MQDQVDYRHTQRGSFVDIGASNKVGNYVLLAVEIYTNEVFRDKCCMFDNPMFVGNPYIYHSDALVKAEPYETRSLEQH